MSLPGTRGRRRIYLMRHGAVSYVSQSGKPVDPGDVKLTQEGISQAEAAREMLATIGFDRIVSSDLPRAKQTAGIVRGERSVELEEEPGFTELRGGRISQMPEERRAAEFVYGLERAYLPGATFAGGEVFADFEARVVDALEKLLSEPGWVRMLLVAHDGVNRMLLAHACGAGLRGLGAFEQDMGCINVLDFDIIDGRVVRSLLKAVNVTPYNISKHGMYDTSFEQVFKTLFDF